MIKLIKASKILMLAGVGFSLLWLVVVEINNYGQPFVWQKWFDARHRPILAAITFSYTYYNLSSLLKWELERQRKKKGYMLLIRLLDGRCFLHLTTKEQEMFTVTFYQRIVNIADALKSYYTEAMDPDHTIRTTAIIKLLHFSPHALLAPQGVQDPGMWCQQFAVTDDVVGISDVGISGAFVEVKPEILEYAEVDLGATVLAASYLRKAG
jgi:hypothetical protein